MNNFRLIKAITIIALGASLTAYILGFNRLLFTSAIALLIGFLFFLLISNQKSIISYYAALERKHSIPHAKDAQLWGVKPEYRKMAVYVIPLVVILGLFSFLFGIDAANGALPSRVSKLIYNLFGSKGVIFMWFTLGIIFTVSSTEMIYYLTKTRKNA
jgi:hypothetical protein